MNREKMMLLMTTVCLAVSGCSRKSNTTVEIPDMIASGNLTQEEVMDTESTGSYKSIRINEALMETMMISDDTDREIIACRAREKLLDSRLTLGFPENGGLPKPESCVDGFSIKEHGPYVYIYRMATGDAAYDEIEMFSSVLAYLSVLEYIGFSLNTNDSMTRIYDGVHEVAHFVVAGTMDSGYLMYLQIME